MFKLFDNEPLITDNAFHHVANRNYTNQLSTFEGTRSAAILGLQWMPNVVGGWIDLDRGVLHRGAEGRVETNKRQPPCPLPTKLIGHLRRVRKQTRQYAVVVAPWSEFQPQVFRTDDYAAYYRLCLVRVSEHNSTWGIHPHALVLEESTPSSAEPAGWPWQSPLTTYLLADFRHRGSRQESDH